MKKINRLLLSLLVLTFLSMGNQKKTKVIFFGDSITQAAVKPGGYIALMIDSLQRSGRLASYELMGAGISGNKVYDLYLRMEDDVLAKSPDAVVIWIGVNDVWHKATQGTGTDAAKFEKFYEAIIRKLQAKNIRVTLVTPAAIGERTDNSNQQDGDLNHYSNIIRRLAKKYNTGLVDLRHEFQKYNLEHNKENKESGILTTDRVHLNDKGNAFVAEKMYAALVKE